MHVFIWSSFVIFILAMVLLDLGVVRRQSRVVSVREALAWTAVWIGLALVFNVFVYFLYEASGFGWSEIPSHHLTGREAALQFFTSYLLEKSLSIDNLLVTAMIFANFRVPLAEQQRVLLWGVLGAMVLRGTMIRFVAVLIAEYGWIVYILGILLVLLAVKLLRTWHDDAEPVRNLAVRLVRRFYPVGHRYEGSRFFSIQHGRMMITPLMLTLIVVETSDAVAAVDSILAIFAVTHDPFLVFTSNMFALLGLRSLYFALAGMMVNFRYMKMSLVFLLLYFSAVMVLSPHLAIPTGVSLAIIAVSVSVAVIVSLQAWRKGTVPPVSPLVDDMGELAIQAYRHARRVVIFVLGTSVVLAGVVMLVMPGPAFIVIPVGLAILGIEFAWARRWLKKMGKAVKSVQGQLTKSRNDG